MRDAYSFERRPYCKIVLHFVLGRDEHTGKIGWFHGSFVQADSEARFVMTRRAFTPDADKSKNTLAFAADERLRILAEPNEQWWIAMRLTGESRLYGVLQYP